SGSFSFAQASVRPTSRSGSTRSLLDRAMKSHFHQHNLDRLRGKERRMQLSTRGFVLLVLVLAVGGCVVPSRQVTTTQGGTAALPARQRFLEMWARAYFPGRTGQLMVVPREGDFITRPDPNVAYMHGSPWVYDVSIPLMFVGPAVKTGAFSVPA